MEITPQLNDQLLISTRYNEHDNVTSQERAERFRHRDRSRSVRRTHDFYAGDSNPSLAPPTKSNT